jgi:hypothetical protein
MLSSLEFSGKLKKIEDTNKGKAVPIWTYIGSKRYTTSRLPGFLYNWHMKAEHTTSKVTGDLSGPYSVHSSNEHKSVPTNTQQYFDVV